MNPKGMELRTALITDLELALATANEVVENSTGTMQEQAQHILTTVGYLLEGFKTKV